VNAPVREAYENTRALVGMVRSRDLGRIDRRDLDRFSVAVGDVVPPGEPGLPRAAHPLYLTAVLGWGAGPANEELRPDGTEILDIDAIPLSGLRLMGGGQDLEFHADVTEGMQIRAELTLEGAEIKDGRTGPLLLLHLVRRYTDQRGTLLVTCRETLMAR
jgi:hypothetical protein